MIVYTISARGVGRLPGKHRVYTMAERKMLKAAEKYGDATVAACCTKCWKTMEPKDVALHVCETLNPANALHEIIKDIAEQKDLAIDERSLEEMLRCLDEKVVG